ncbi:MAG TPA: hypothetical protein VGJ54_02220 [Streptosporangiaceae bacterium]
MPAASAAHGSQPARVPARRCASSTSDATTSIPSTETGNACARHPTSPCSRASSAIWEYEIAPATPASPTTVAPAAPTIARSTALIAHQPNEAGK